MSIQQQVDIRTLQEQMAQALVRLGDLEAVMFKPEADPKPDVLTLKKAQSRD
jgi:hypothetical protein